MIPTQYFFRVLHTLVGTCMVSVHVVWSVGVVWLVDRLAKREKIGL